MLIQKPASLGDVVTFRISSGEEVIGKWVADNADSIVIDKPISIALQMHSSGQPGLAFAPFMLSFDDSGKLAFYKANIVTAPVVTRKDVSMNYISATSSIVQPQATGGLV